MKGAWAALLGAAITGTALTLGILLAPLLAPSVWDARVRTTLQLVGDALICLRIVGGMGIVALGTAIAILIEHWRSLRRKNKMVYADEKTRLFPVIPADWNMRVLAPERAQVASAIASGGRPLAATVKTVLAEQLPPPPEQLALPAPQLPNEVSVWNLPKPKQLSMTFGESANGPVTWPLEDLGNVGVAGLQGYGKTEYLAAMIAYALRQDATGHHIKLIIVDMKRLDFTHLPPDLAALWRPVAREPEEALAHIKDMHDEMRARQLVLNEAGCDHIETYRQQGGEMPYLLCFIDELSYLLSGVGAEGRRLTDAFLDYALKVNRIGRATGGNITWATQMASGQDIPTPLRHGSGVQVAFRMPDHHASQSILSMPDAAQLEDIKGRALVRRGGLPILVQGYRVDRRGKFKEYLNQLPRNDGMQPQQSVLEPVQKSVYQIESPEMVENATIQTGIPVSVPQDREPFDSEAVMQYIYQRYQVLGSLKAVEAEIYGQEGGAKFYWVRHSVATMQRKDR